MSLFAPLHALESEQENLADPLQNHSSNSTIQLIKRRMSSKLLPVIFWLMMSRHGHAVNSDAAAITHGCTGCHETQGAGYGSLPRIAGMDRQLFLEAMRGFKQDDRPATVMNRIAIGFTDSDLLKLADYFCKNP